MEIVAGPLDWTSVDEENLRKFFGTETGKRLIPRLADLVPPLLEAGDTNALLVRCGKVRGYQEALQNLLALSYTQEEPKQQNANAYPPLEDDKAWNDGKKLEPLTE